MSAPKRHTPLRDQIAAYLATVEEATAAQIAKHTSEKDYPSRVLRELNDMRTDTVIECGKKGKGRDLSYWLTSAAAPSAPAEIPSRTTEGADQRRRIIRAAIAGKTARNGPAVKDLAAACGITGQAVENLVAPMISAGTVGKVRNDGERFHRFFDRSTEVIAPPQPEVGHNTGSDGSDLSGSMDSAEAVAVLKPAPASCANTAPVAEDDVRVRAAGEAKRDEVGSPVFDKLDGMYLLNVLADIRAAMGDAEGRLMQDELAPKIAALARDAAELAATEQKRLTTTAALTAAMQQLDAIREHLAPFPIGVDAASMTEVELAESAAAAIRDGLDRIFAKSSDDGTASELANARALADKLQHLLDSKTHECEALRAELANTRTDGEQAVDVLDAAHGYLVKAPKRKPRFLTQPEAARNAAMACARNGSGRGDVYALVHVGTAKRGAEWTEPN